MAKLEDILRYHGDPGKCQIIIWLLLLFTLFHVGMVQQYNILIFDTPKHHCKVQSNWTAKYNASLLYNGNCSMYINPENHSLGSENCEEYEYKRFNDEVLPVDEFNLVCDPFRRIETVISLTFVGVLIGGLTFGNIADRYGRKKTLCLIVSFLSILSISIKFIPNFGAFTAVRLILGIFSQGMQTICLTYSSELFLPKMRTLTQNAIGYMWAIMLPLLALLFYTLADWRLVHLSMGILSLISAVYVWWLPESVSWLVNKRKIDEAVAILDHFAKVNNIQRNETLKNDLEEVALNLVNKNEKNKDRSKWTDLIKTPTIRRITLTLLYIWFTCACSIYGLSFSVNALKANNKYINFGILGILELIIRLAITPFFVRYGRITVLVPILLASGCSAIVAYTVLHYYPDNIVQIIFGIIALIARNLLAINFTMLVIVTSELVPVSLRSTGVGFGFAAARVGNIIAPYSSLLKTVWSPLPQVCYGIMVIISGLMLLTLPETLNKPLPNTIEDVEKLVKSKIKIQEIKTAKELVTSIDNEMHLQTLIDKVADITNNGTDEKMKI